MSGSDRADGQTGGPRDVFSMPREYSFSCMSENSKEKRRDRDAFTRRLSSSISLDGGAAGGPPLKRRLGGELMSSGRSGGGVSSNGWHDEVISRSKSFTEPGTHGGNSSGRVAPRSPRIEFSSPDCSSPKEMDGYRFSTKPSSPLYTQSRISSLAQTSHHNYSGKGILGREHSRYSEWDYTYKADMDYRDKIWGRSELHRRTGSGYESSTTSTMHKDNEGRREHEGYAGSGDSPGSSSYHIRSYQEWRQSERISTAGLPLRSHVSTNGYLKESGGRVQGFPDMLGSWHSPLSSPANYAVDLGRDDGIQTSPRKRPRLGWGQGLAKYEQKITGTVEDSPGTKGRGTSCSEEISSQTESPHQATGHEQTVSSTKAVSDKTNAGATNLFSEVDKDTPIMQMEQKTETSDTENVIDQSKQSGSMPASMTGRLENCESLDVPLYVNSHEKADNALQVHPRFMVSGQYCNEYASGSLKANILQRLEKLELELELTEKELGKIEDQPEDHPLSENDCIIDDTRNSMVFEGHFAAHATEQKDVATEVLHVSEVGEPEREVIDEQTERPFSGIQVNSLDEITDTAKGGSKLHISLETHYPSFDSSHKDLVSNKDDDGLVKASNSQVISFKERSLSAASFSELDRTTEITGSKEMSSENLVTNGQSQLFSINGTTIKKHVNVCWKDLYNENTEEAKKASKVFSSLLPDAYFEAGWISVCKVKEIQVQEESIEKDEKIKQQLQNMLLQKKMSYRFGELVLALKYRALRESWKREQVGLCQWTDRIEGLKKLDAERKNGTMIPTQRSSHRLRLSVSGTVKVDSASDELQTMQKFLSEPFGVYQRPHLRMPSQILGERERKVQRFITNNSLIEDPVAFEQERKTINPWTPEERKMFLEKFALYNKDFQKIASFIEHKTVADCIEFYYRNQKSEDFEAVRHRQQLKNCRDYPRSSRYLSHSTPPSSRRREIAANCVENLPTALAMASYKEDGAALCGYSSKHVQNDYIDSVGANSFENPPANSGSASWRNITMEQFNKVQVDQSSQYPTSITEEYDSQWTDSERQLFVTALGLFGKDFRNISQHVATKGEGQCKAFFSKTRKRLGLDQVLQDYEKNLHMNSDQAEERTENLNVGACAEHGNHANVDHILTYVKDVTGVPVSNCLPTDSVAGLGMYSANSTEELLTTECISTGNGEEVCNKEDERSLASDPDLGDSLPENNQAKAACSNIEEQTETKQEMAVINDIAEQTETKQEKALHNDIEDQIQGTEQNVTPLSTETWIEPKEEKFDFPGILMNPVSEPQTQVEYVNNDMIQQEVHMDESLPNNGTSKSRDDKETHVTASEVVLERPTVEETDSQPDFVNQSMQECPDITQTSHSSSNHTSPPAVISSISTITCTSQPKTKVNLNVSESKPRREATSWTQDEKEKFVEIIRKHGRDWGLLQENLPAKSLTQIKTYFQNSKAKLGFTAAEGLQSRSSATRKTKNDDSDPANTLYRLASHKVASLSEDSALTSDSIVNGGVNTMLGMPGSDGLSFTFSGKGTWQAEDPTVLNGMQKLFQQMCQKGYSQQSMTTNGLFPVLQPSSLSVIMGPGFHQPQSLNLQQSHSPSSSSKSQSATPQQTQQIVGLSQLQCGLQPPILNQIKQQQKTSHSQQEYQNQGLQEFQKRIMQHQAVQSLQQNISTSVLQQQQSPQPQVTLQQQNPQQHLSQSSHHIQHPINQNLHYMQQKSSLQSQLSSNQQQVINQHQSQSQQLLMSQLQLHYDNQQKQYHMLQGNQVSQQEQHSIFRSLQEQLTCQLHNSQQQLQSEKQPQPLRMNLPIHMHENSEISQQQQGQGPDTLPEKEHRQWKEVHTNQSPMLHKGSNQANNRDVSNLQDSIEIKNVLKSQTQETHQTRAGDVKLFGQFLLSQPTSSSNSIVSTSESGFSKPMLSLSSTSVSPVAASILEGLPYAYPDGTPCLPSGFGRIGLSFSQGQARQSTSAGNIGLRNNLLDGKEHACLTPAADSETDMQSSQTMISCVPERFAHDGKESDNIRPEGGSSYLKYEVGEQSKRLHDGQNPVIGFGSKRQGDQSNNFSLSAGDFATISDLKSGVPCLSSAADLSIIMSRYKDVDLSSAIGAMLGVSSSPQALNALKSVIPNTQPQSLAQSFVGGIEAMQVNRDDSFPGQQGISHGSGNVGLDVSLWSSGASVGHGSDLQRVTVPIVSSVWPHGSVIIEGQPRPKESKDVEDNKRQTA